MPAGHQRTRLTDWWRANVLWRGLPQARLDAEISLGDHGGCQLFVHDINDDGRQEFLWLQSAGIFKSGLYAQGSSARVKYLLARGQDVCCLTATDRRGTVLWQYGEPCIGERPYLTHAPERMVCCGDVDGDGHTEVLLLDGGNQLLMLDGGSGKVKKAARLPADNFSVVECGSRGLEAGGKGVIVAGVMADAYAPYSYGNPWLFLDSDLAVLREGQYPGAGHQVIAFDANNDGVDEFLIGYQLVSADGDVLWTADDVDPATLDAERQHVDHMEVFAADGDWYAAVAGSDKQYLIDSAGHVVWSRALPHAQYCVTGRVANEPLIFVLNQRLGMNCFDMRGREVWAGLLPEFWPMGRPAGAFGQRPIHSNTAAGRLEVAGRADSLILYKEGGWPYAVTFFGKPAMNFPYTGGGGSRGAALPGGLRLNDVGLSYEAEVCCENGVTSVVVYDRNHAWLYGP